MLCPKLGFYLGARRRIPAHIKVSLDEQDTSGSKLSETILM